MMTEDEVLELAEMYHDCALNTTGRLANHYNLQMWKVLFLAEGYDGDFFDPLSNNKSEGQIILECLMQDWWRGSEEKRYGESLYKIGHAVAA